MRYATIILLAIVINLYVFPVETLYPADFIVMAKPKSFEDGWSASTWKKYHTIVGMGMNGTLTKHVINSCKKLARDPAHCVITAIFIAGNESTFGNNAYKSNVWGINSKYTWNNARENFDRWIQTYTKFWYKTKGPIDFYSPKPGLPKTRYCTHEYQPNGRKLKYCPNGYKHSTKIFNILKKSFYEK